VEDVEETGLSKLQLWIMEHKKKEKKKLELRLLLMRTELKTRKQKEQDDYIKQQLLKEQQVKEEQKQFQQFLLLLHSREDSPFKHKKPFASSKLLNKSVDRLSHNHKFEENITAVSSSLIKTCNRSQTSVLNLRGLHNVPELL
jgi:hypothetical protein